MPDVIDSNQPKPEEDAEHFPAQKYWGVVRDTVERVFNGDINDVEQTRTRLQDAPPGTQRKFYQTDPYNVAADIARQKDAGTPDQWRRYIDIRKNHGFGDPDSPADLQRPYRT